MSATDRLTGRVKWFNNKAGYGFITVLGGDLANKDVFVHYTKISVSDSQYKYLVQGEYVEFVLDSNTNGDHEFQATNISGIQGGQIMCETRRENRSLNESGEGADEVDAAPLPLRRTSSVRPQRPRRESSAGADDEGFKTVSRKKTPPVKRVVPSV